MLDISSKHINDAEVSDTFDVNIGCNLSWYETQGSGSDLWHCDNGVTVSWWVGIVSEVLTFSPVRHLAPGPVMHLASYLSSLIFQPIQGFPKNAS